MTIFTLLSETDHYTIITIIKFRKLNMNIVILSVSPMAQGVKYPPAMQETQVDAWVKKIPWRRKWQPTPAFLPGESHRKRSWQATQSTGLQRVGHNGVTKHAGVHNIIIQDNFFP